MKLLDELSQCFVYKVSVSQMRAQTIEHYIEMCNEIRFEAILYLVRSVCERVKLNAWTEIGWCWLCI